MLYITVLSEELKYYISIQYFLTKKILYTLGLKDILWEKKKQQQQINQRLSYFIQRSKVLTTVINYS